jgi:NADH-quinone oxidoreductase subunit N
MHDLFRVLALLGAINAAIAAYYYLRVLMALYLRSSITAPMPKPAPLLAIVATVCAVLTVGLGVYPVPLLKIVRAAFAAL